MPTYTATSPKKDFTASKDVLKLSKAFSKAKFVTDEELSKALKHLEEASSAIQNIKMKSSVWF